MASLDMIPDAGIAYMIAAEQDAYDRDETVDHLKGSSSAPVSNRAARRRVAQERIIRMIQEHGNGYRSASMALRRSAERHFGSWAKACCAAGIDPPPLGRPKSLD